MEDSRKFGQVRQTRLVFLLCHFLIKTKVCYVFTFFRRPSYQWYCLNFQKMNIGHVNQQVYYSIAGYWLIYGHLFITVVQSYVIIILGKIGVVASTKSFSLLEYLLGNTKFYSNLQADPNSPSFLLTRYFPLYHFSGEKTIG